MGFSTGALAKGDYRRGLELQRALPRARAVELSALRDHELQPLLDGLGELDLGGLDYVSVHAPSKLGSLSERETFERLAALPEAWPIIVHPCIVHSFAMWRELGPRLCLENMDNRKTTGRNAAELRVLFEQLPEATFCLDVGHARQIDPTMALALLMLHEHGSRLRQLHVSDVGPRGEHQPVRALARWAFARVARLVPESCPLIIESVVPPDRLEPEIEAVLEAFGPMGSGAPGLDASAPPAP
ncbi:MAG: hypothetical protein H6712_11980 [Myxococcales bacterium]|nr:hypothetical protein [Myxococcales bacterium]MCB9714574.1 hypothetical protein [Myxococcales bacterium]